MDYFRCTDPLQTQLDAVLKILVVRGAARAGWDYSHLPVALLNKRVALTFVGGSRVREQRTVGQVVKSVRLNAYGTDPTTLAIRAVLERCTDAQQFFETCYVLCMFQTARAAKAMLRTHGRSDMNVFLCLRNALRSIDTSGQRRICKKGWPISSKRCAPRRATQQTFGPNASDLRRRSGTHCGSSGLAAVARKFFSVSA